MRYVELTEEHLPAAAGVVAATTRRRAAWTGPGARPVGSADLAAVAETTLRPYVDDATRIAYVAVDGDDVHAVLGGLYKHLTPADPEYVYQAPHQLVLATTACAARDENAEAEHLPELFARIRVRAREREGIDRIGVGVLAADWWSGALWRGLGLRPEIVFALRPVRVPERVSSGIRVRAAGADDLDALVRLSLDEILYHAHHTATGTSPHQDVETIRKQASGWWDHHADESVERAFVAEDGEGTVVGMTTVRVVTAAAESVAQFVLPRRYAYVGLTDVVASSRGSGVGAALAAHVLAWTRALPDPPELVGLHYASDNALSAPFWSARGYAPAATFLTTAPRHRVDVAPGMGGA